VYNLNLNRRQEVTACNDAGDNNCVTDARTDPVAELTVDGAFAQSSPSRRLYLSSQSVSFCLRNQQLYRHVDNINQNQTLYTSGGTLMAKGIVNSLSSNPLTSPGSEDPFQVFAADLRRNSFVQMRLTFSENDEALSFSQEVHIANTP
jgi:MSHA biogenesis protein MshO